MMDIVVSEPVWTHYFNREEAVRAVAAHIAALPSSRTPEQHTRRAYQDGLEAFNRWVGERLPTPDVLRVYVAELVQRGLKSSTISSKYLASVRHYLRALGNQSIMGLEGREHSFVLDCKDQIRQAAAMPTPKPELSTNLPPLWRPDFHRLTLDEVNSVLRQIDRSTLAGLRDYALLHIAFSSGLRLAELARISLSALRPSGSGGWLISVRGKRGNIDPVPISADAYADILAAVDAFNAGLAADDSRRIAGTVPVFQPLHRQRYYMAAVRYATARGLSHQAIRDAVKKHTLLALGYAIAVHDTRRTAAALAYDAGMLLPDIQLFMRHKNSAITLSYIGTKPDFHTRSLATYMSFG